MALLDWPGKSPKENGLPFHPAPFHMLDVAAVAERLIEPFCLDRALRDALVLLIALHDLGKISKSFRRMLEEGEKQRFPHWKLTEVLLFEFDHDLLAKHLGSDPYTRQSLYAAVSGHHGRPSDLNLGGLQSPDRKFGDYRSALREIGDKACVDAYATVSHFCELWPEASLDVLSNDRAVELSWWLPGLCTAADWIGSNTDWFKQENNLDTDLADYLKQAREIAVGAVAEAGLAGAKTSNTHLFDFALRPMQSACADVALPEGPMLAVIEDETGTGKTEAAIILAQRMLLAGKGRGIFFALPTMATADAMFRRAASVIGRLFGKDATLTLAHGRAGLSVDFQDIVSADVRSEDDVTCSDWLAESGRRALLADVGVGTIDQALLSVLPVKFQALRHFGLSSKILIVDEVHELGEPYIGAELEALLCMHRAIGGSAILLTATLPMPQRARLLSVYDGAPDNCAYPALTVAGGAAVTNLPQRTGSKGAVRVDRLSNIGEAVEILAMRAHQGAACVWVRNAVDDAIAAVEALRMKGIEAQLLHARFTLSDRKRIEAEVLARAGKEASDRAGFVLIGTQVLESSLDLDFDVMVSDLAPMAALIQRAGRLWRHMDIRPTSSRPMAAPILHVISPDPNVVTDDSWLQGTLDRGAYVYPVADQWRTARVLFDEAQIEAPSRLRALIEAVHGADAMPVPEVLQETEFVIKGQGAADRSHAAHNIVDLANGYRRGGQAHDDAKYPTRLGEDQRVLVLARVEKGKLRPWAEAERDAWALSEVSAGRKRLCALSLPDQTASEIEAVTRTWPDWKRKEFRLCPVGPDGTICEGLRYDADIGLIMGDKS